MIKLIMLAGCMSIFLVSPLTSAEPRNLCHRADINRDGVVNIADLSILLHQYGKPAQPGRFSADMNRDGLVNITDLSMLLHYYGDSCKATKLYGGDNG